MQACYLFHLLKLIINQHGVKVYNNSSLKKSSETGILLELNYSSDRTTCLLLCTD
jgi:hypothetical protein